MNTYGSKSCREKEERYPSDYSHVSAVPSGQSCDQSIQFCVSSCKSREMDVQLTVSLCHETVHLHALLSASPRESTSGIPSARVLESFGRARPSHHSQSLPPVLEIRACLPHRTISMTAIQVPLSVWKLPCWHLL